MKKVNLGKRENTEVYLEDLTNESHVGFVYGTNKKCYVVWIDGEFIPVTTLGDGESGNDSMSKLASENLKDCIPLSLIKELFVFETRKELYKWLADDESEVEYERTIEFHGSTYVLDEVSNVEEMFYILGNKVKVKKEFIYKKTGKHTCERFDCWRF